MKYLNFQNKIFLITGGTGHIGSVTVKEILKLGGRLIITSSSKKNIFNLKKKLNNKFNKKYEIILTDFNKETDIEHLIKLIKSKYSYLNGIINNAYSGNTGAIDLINKTDFTKAINFNLYLPFKLIKDLKNLMIKGAIKTKSQSSIINISSMYGTVSPDKSIYDKAKNLNPIHYGATKSGLIQMTKYLACNLNPKKIRVNSISPGPIIKSNISKIFIKKIEKKVPIGRVGKPMEVALPIIFLLSDLSTFINGANLPVDGGWTAW